MGIKIQQDAKISIHALREEGDSATFSLTTIRLPFLSTPSARRATVAARFLPG